MTMYNLCYEIARQAHEGQKRWNGDPYITHPERVANSFKNQKLRCIAILHDVIEDTEETAKSLMVKGVQDEIALSVSILTKKKNQTYVDYIKYLGNDKLCTKVKLADLDDNLSDLKKGSQRDKYMLAKELLIS